MIEFGFAEANALGKKTPITADTVKKVSHFEERISYPNFTGSQGK